MTKDTIPSLFAKTAPIYWPVLWLSLYALSIWMRRVRAMGYTHCAWTVSPRGIIRVTQLARAPANAPLASSPILAENPFSDAEPNWPQSVLRPVQARVLTWAQALVKPAVPAPP